MTEAEFYRTPPTVRGTKEGCKGEWLGGEARVHEVTSARMALLLKKNGISRVRPLVGGVEAWRALNYPLEDLEAKVV